MSLLKNAWYCAGWSTDVTDAPVHRKILGQDIALFRDSKGKVNAIGNLCPHRFASLHQGKVKQDVIECPYHGLQFDGSGACVLNPHGNGQLPPSTRVPAFRVEERTGTIWIWMGEADAADPAQIVEVPFLNDSENFAYFTGHHPLKANYFLVVDNLLDQTHAQFLHPETVFGKGSSDRWEVHLSERSREEKQAPQEVWFEEDEASVTAHYMMRDKPRPPLWDPLIDEERVDLYSRTIWYAPANMDLSLRLNFGEGGRQEANMTAMHFITPIDDLHSYYFYAVGWDTKVDDVEATRRVRDIVLQTIMDEDGPMFEECQKNMGAETDLFAMKPVLLQTDGIGIKARRRMGKVLAAQT